MPDEFNVWKKPETKELYLLAGWRQWADAGSVSSGLPEYLVETLGAEKIGEMRPDGFYLFQIPGTHDLMRPVIKLKQGYPESLDGQKNELFYSGNDQHGLVIFRGDEPHMDIERYVAAFLQMAKDLGVKRIIGLGGVYGELPYDKERPISCMYSLPQMKAEIGRLAVSLSDYQGGASIESVICRRAGEQDVEFTAFYAFVPAYEVPTGESVGNSFRLDNDYSAWLGILRRINYLLKYDFDLSDLEDKSHQLVELLDSRVEEFDSAMPQLGVRDYLKRISDGFHEVVFNPGEEVWDEELRRLLDKFDWDESS